MVSSFNLNDIDEINSLGQILNSKFISLFHIDKLNPNEKIYVYKKDGQIVGFIHFSSSYETAELLNIIVKTEHQSQGIASTLMDYMLTELPKEVTHILLEVNENNKNAIKLYNKFNFTIINRRKNYYKDGDALIMERKII